MVIISKIYKVELYITDIDDEYYGISIENHLEHVLQELESLVHISKIEESKEFEWEDNLKINMIDSTTEDLEEYFK